MRKNFTVEYNTYGLENPARDRHKEAQRLFQDIYFFVSDTISIKKRIIGGKERIIIDTVKLTTPMPEGIGFLA
ncbi:MAG: hypothetical protein EPN86_03850 [Nanoarchaeota archaeon]|nr:MAG: hypothetical protein EPN86_03850 [Nanoarchaeota archaeon]